MFQQTGSSGYNDLLTLNPQLVGEWDYDKNELLPSQVTVSSSKHIFWKCSKGHSWKAKISLRNIGGTGCPVCDGKIVQAGFNDLLTHNPKLAGEWDIAKNRQLPSQVTPYSTKKVFTSCAARADVVEQVRVFENVARKIGIGRRQSDVKIVDGSSLMLNQPRSYHHIKDFAASSVLSGLYGVPSPRFRVF